MRSPSNTLVQKNGKKCLRQKWISTSIFALRSTGILVLIEIPRRHNPISSLTLYTSCITGLAKGKYCPIPPLFLENETGKSPEEKIRYQEKLAVILQGNNVYFSTKEVHIKLYAPKKFKYGRSTCHLDFDVDPKSVMEPFARAGQNAIQHTIGEVTQQIVRIMRDPKQKPLPNCDLEAEPLVEKDTTMVYVHDKSKTGSTVDVTEIPKKTTNQSSVAKKSKQQRSKATKSVKKAFAKILRLDSHFKARLQMANFKSKNMERFSVHEKESGIIVEHRQHVVVDDVLLPIAVARQIEDEKTIRRISGHPKYVYDIDIFVDNSAKWDFNSVLPSGGKNGLGFQSTLLKELTAAFRFTNFDKYVDRMTDDNGNGYFTAVNRKLFLDDDFEHDWMEESKGNEFSDGLNADGRKKFK